MAMSPRLLRPKASGFSPRSIASLRAWYDASDDAQFTYSTGTNVSQWNDKSGYGFNAVNATAASQPTRNATRNGKTAVSFPNSSRFLSISNFAAAFPSAATGIFVFGPSGSTYNIFFTSVISSFTSFSGAGYSAFFRANRIAATPTMPSTGFHVFTWISSGSEYTIRQNGTQLLTTTADYSAGSSHRIGSTSNGNEANHTSCEMCLFNESLPLATIQRLERWLGSRWGITVA